MFIRVFIKIAFIVLAATGCSLEKWDVENNDKTDPHLTKCKKSESTGCVYGYVPSAPDLYVEGKKFFDVDELISNFDQLFEVRDYAGKARARDAYSIHWKEEIDNDTFANGFNVYVKGSSAKNSSVLRNGEFSLNYLPEGYYDIRVQRVIELDIKVVQNAGSPGTVTAESEDSEAVSEESVESNVKTHSYCIALYADNEVEIEEGKIANTLIFDRYKLEIKTCEAITEKEPDQVVVL